MGIINAGDYQGRTSYPSEKIRLIVIFHASEGWSNTNLLFTEILYAQGRMNLLYVKRVFPDHGGKAQNAIFSFP